MVRFHIVVLNFERLVLFLENFHRIKNFDPEKDKIYILDCSNSHKKEQEQLINFLDRRGWKLNEQAYFIRRRNWGIDQGSRIDYFRLLSELPTPPQYVWQFQEHYLDLTSPCSRFPAEMAKIGGEIKADIAPDSLIIDLDECERIYEQDPAVSMLYAARLKMILFSHPDGREWFYANGGNYSIRTSYALQVYQKELLDSYKMIYDGKSDWTLFMEMDQGYHLTRKQVKWYDLVSGYSFDLPETLRKLEIENDISLQQDKEHNHESYYGPLYTEYQQRCFKALNTHPTLRSLLSQKAIFVDGIKGKLRGIKRRILPQPASKPLIVLQDGELKKY